MDRCFLLKLIHLILKAHYNLRVSRRDNAIVAVRPTRELYLFLNHSATAAVPLATHKPTYHPLRQRRI
jgi:hypothetical protein